MAKATLLVALLSCVLFVCVVNAQNCGCGAGQCCSQYGYCGTTAEYCSCSPSNLKGSCPSGQCCSQYGYCGAGASYCGNSPAPVPSTGACSPTNTKGSCAAGQCCSQYGYCGSGAEYCGNTPAPVPSAPTPPPSGSSCLANWFKESDFNALFPHRNGAANSGTAGQYAVFTYNNLITAAKAFPEFGCTGSDAQKKKELSAFFAQTAHETGGGTAGDYNWGYYYSSELAKSDYCQSSAQYPCAGGKQYYGRGPMQLSWNYNYGAFSQYLYGNVNQLINNPDSVLTDGPLAFKSGLWYWMKQTPINPHSVITGQYNGRYASGFGLITDIINGGIECGRATTPQVQDRVGYYQAFNRYFGISDNTNLYCDNLPAGNLQY